MKALVDEQLHHKVADAINMFSDAHAVVGVHIEDIRPGTPDEDIPKICRDNDCDLLVSANVRDFGARIALYRTLLSQRVSAVVMRPGRLRLTPEEQVALIVRMMPRAAAFVRDADEPVLIKVTQTEVVVRTLEELIEEIMGPVGGLP